jgi:hypothetical protein
MFIVIYALAGLAVLVVTNLFSFAVGRCARELPVIDYGLPWVMHRSAVPPPDHGARSGGCAPRSAPKPRPLAGTSPAAAGTRQPQQPATGRLSCTTPRRNSGVAVTSPHQRVARRTPP